MQPLQVSAALAAMVAASASSEHRATAGMVEPARFSPAAPAGTAGMAPRLAVPAGTVETGSWLAGPAATAGVSWPTDSGPPSSAGTVAMAGTARAWPATAARAATVVMRLWVTTPSLRGAHVHGSSTRTWSKTPPVVTVGPGVPVPRTVLAVPAATAALPSTTPAEQPPAGMPEPAVQGLVADCSISSLSEEMGAQAATLTLSRGRQPRPARAGLPVRARPAAASQVPTAPTRRCSESLGKHPAAINANQRRLLDWGAPGIDQSSSVRWRAMLRQGRG